MFMSSTHSPTMDHVSSVLWYSAASKLEQHSEETCFHRSPNLIEYCVISVIALQRILINISTC